MMICFKRDSVSKQSIFNNEGTLIRQRQITPRIAAASDMCTTSIFKVDGLFPVHQFNTIITMMTGVLYLASFIMTYESVVEVNIISD